MASWVNLSIDDQGIAKLELARIQAGNALNRKLVEDIAEAVDQIANNHSIRALVITGQGSSFCVGGDVHHFVQAMDALQTEFEYMISRWHQSLLTLASLPIPVVAGIHGGIGGGGLGIVWCADHVIAASNTKMAAGFSALGVTGDGGNSWHLPRLIGVRRAKEMLLENKVVNAQTALDWGLVNAVVELSALQKNCYEKAMQMASLSKVSISAMKQLLAQSSYTDFEQQLKDELKNMLECTDKTDVKVGMQAFSVGEKPQFEK